MLFYDLGLCILYDIHLGRGHACDILPQFGAEFVYAIRATGHADLLECSLVCVFSVVIQLFYRTIWLGKVRLFYIQIDQRSQFLYIRLNCFVLLVNLSTHKLEERVTILIFDGAWFC